VLPWIFVWAFFLLLWHVFEGRFAPDILLYGIVACSITLFAARIVLQERLTPLRTQFRFLAQAWRLPKLIVTGAWEVVAVLARQIFLRKPADSLLYSVPFDAGADDEDSAFRRALAIGYTTATPNFVIIGIDREKGLLVYHQIRKSPVPEMTKRLGAKG
jgi:multisubunit Na+/H+ antiporter MnhE subunit